MNFGLLGTANAVIFSKKGLKSRTRTQTDTRTSQLIFNKSHVYMADLFFCHIIPYGMELRLPAADKNTSQVNARAK